MSTDSTIRNAIADRLSIHLLEGDGPKNHWVTISCNGVSITYEVSQELYAALKDAFGADYRTFRA